MRTKIKKRKPLTKKHKRDISKKLTGRKLSKETKRKISEVMKGRIISEETKKKMSLAGIGKKRNLGHKHTEKTLKQMSKVKIGDKNPNWKGDKVKYRALHTWVRNSLGIPSQCKFCGKTDKEVKIEWANKSGKYLRELNDWIPLCKKCHRRYDKYLRIEGFKKDV